MLGERIKKLILIRLLFATTLLFLPAISLEKTEVPFYAASTFICLLSGFYLLWYLTRRWYRWLAFIQITLDLLLETYLLSFTGGAESLFAVFYPLSILSAALVIGEKQAVVFTTVFSSVAYLAGSFAANQMGISSSLIQDRIYFFYGTTMRITIFLIVGYLSRYLSGTILELQNRLKLSERLSFLGEGVAKVSHEIRNPLSAVRTAAEVLRDSLQGKLNPQEEKMISVIDSESDRLTKMLQRILNYAKQVQPNPKMLLLDPLIERTLGVVRLHSQIHSNGIMVEKKYDVARTHVYADEEQVLGALLNLTLNAYQAMPGGGTFRICAEEKLRGTKIDLEDSGEGVPREKLKDLFLPFKSTKKVGTGLGLAEVHKIVTLHEGKMGVESQAGKGTIFHLYFPKP